MPDKTEDKKPQLVQPQVPGGGIYETFREPVPGTKPATSPADAAAATAAATSVEPGLQAAILNLLPQWRPLLERVEALEAAEDKTDAHLQLAERDDRLDALDATNEASGKAHAESLAHRTAMSERLDALAAMVAELREELGNDDDDDQGTPPKEK